MKQFKLNPPGRTRTGPPLWHAPNTRSTIIATDIYVQLRPGQEATPLEKLKAIQRSDRYTFPGTIARYAVKGDPEMSSAHFFFIWKHVEVPVEVTYQRDLTAFQEELADGLDWEMAQYSTNEVIIHT